MEFRLLGPLEVVRDGEPVALGGAKQRAVLAVLLLHRGDAVSVDRLGEALWGEHPPRSAANALQVYISGLRKALGADRLVTKAPGYLLRVEPEELDAARFERLAGEGRLAEALAVWRGDPLADFAYERFAQTEIARLDELRLTAVEDLIEERLARGEHAEVVAELEARVAEEPLRERLRAQLMLALYRAGRHAAALEVYRTTRQLLRDELGIEPSRSLQRLEGAILRQEAALELALPPREELADRAPARKPVTALVACPDPGEALDPEAEDRLLQEVAAQATSVLGRHGARVDAAPDGSLLALFGVPAVREDDALRAARAALALGDRLRVGVASGLAVVTGTPGAPRVAGSVVREATRLGRLAGPGQTLVSASTRELLGEAGAVERTAAGELLLREIASEAVAIPRRLDAPLVGREAEVTELAGILDDVLRRPRVEIVNVLGPPGIGKSRLLRAVADRASDRADVLYGHCPSFGEGVTFRPLAEIVSRLAGADVVAGVEALLADDDEAGLVAERIAGAVGAIERETSTEETAWAARRLLETLAARRPLLVVLEDLHWAEPAFLDLVEHLAASRLDVPLLAVCVSRPELIESRPGWPGSRLELEPLDGAATEALLDRALGNGVDEGLRTRIADTAEGNPLFIEQMAAMLEQRPAQGDDVPVPPSIQALLAARLDLLPAAERRLVDAAAIAGREFSLDGVLALGAEAAPLESLDRLLVVAPAGDGLFRFRHHLIRDSAYDAIPKRARSGLHLRYAGWLEDDAPLTPVEIDELAGYHLEQAYRLAAELDSPEPPIVRAGVRAGAHLRAAAGQAHARAGAPAAVVFLERAAALPHESEPARVELLLELAGARREIGDFDAADTEARDAIAIASALGARGLEAQARALRLRIALQTRSAGSVEALGASVEQTVADLEALGEEAATGHVWWALAWAAWVRSRAEATRLALERAEEAARRTGDEPLLVDCRSLMLGVWVFGPTPVAEALERCERLVGPDGHPRLRATALRACASLHAMLGEFDEARALLVRDRALIDEFGMIPPIAVWAEIAGQVELEAGDPATAEVPLREGIAACEPLGETSGLSTLTAMLADAVVRQGRPDEAFELTETARRLALDDDRVTHVQWRGSRARVFAARGNAAQAEALAAEAVALAEPTDFLALRANALLALAEVTGRSGPAEEARALFERKGHVSGARRATRMLRAAVGPPA